MRSRPPEQEASWSRQQRIKGERNAGGSDPAARVRALDLMGVDRQVVLPSSELWEPRTDSDQALAAASRYNDHAIGWQKATGGRCVVAAQSNTSRIDAALAETARLLRAGARAVILPCFAPPVDPAKGDRRRTRR